MSDDTAASRVKSETSEAFTELVRDALLHLYDLTHLQTHPLIGFHDARTGGRIDGKVLRQALLDAIGAVHPGPGVATTSRAWRSYHILELRYIVGSEVDEVIRQVALSKRQYHREHHRALEAIASILWQDWQPPEARTSPAAPPVSLASISDLTRFEAGQLRPGDSSGQSIDSSAVVKGVRDLLLPLCEQRGVAFDLDVPELLPLVRGDRVALRQGLLSILTPLLIEPGQKAIQLVVAHEAGQIVATIRAGATSPETCRRCIDHGRHFVEALHGSVDCEMHGEPTGAPTIRISIPTGHRPTLLVVDNNADFIHLIERYLVDYGWEIVGAGDVEQAFLEVQRRRPSAVLLDVVLPGADGWDLLLRLKATEGVRDTPVIICSVLREAEVATSLGAAAYLSKPVDRWQLLQTLESVVS